VYNQTAIDELIDEFISSFSTPTQIWTLGYVDILGSFFTASLVTMIGLMLYVTTGNWKIIGPYFIFSLMFVGVTFPTHFALFLSFLAFTFIGGIIYITLFQKEGKRM